MRIVLLTAAILSFGWMPAQDAATKKDLAALQGKWTLVEMEVDGKKVAEERLVNSTLTIKDNKYSLVSFGKQHEVELTLDAAKKPKEIDMKFLDGANKDRVGRGIYQIEGNTLKICRGLDPQQERPQQFKTEGQINYFVMVWQRDP